MACDEQTGGWHARERMRRIITRVPGNETAVSFAMCGVLVVSKYLTPLLTPDPAGSTGILEPN